MRGLKQDESRYDIFVKAMSVKLQQDEPHIVQSQERMARTGQIWLGICPTLQSRLFPFMHACMLWTLLPCKSPLPST